MPFDRKMSIIPQGAEPRWMILGEPSKALPVLRSWRPFKLDTRLKWNLVAFASSINALSHLPGVTSEVASLNLSYWHRWIPGFSPDWTAVIHVGNPSYTRKAILFLVGRDAAVRAVAKIPLTTEAGAAILNEATILQLLHARVDLPQVLFKDGGRGIAAQTWLEGKPVSRAFSPAHIELLGRLAHEDQTVRLCDCREQIAANLERLDLPLTRSRLSQALDLLDFCGDLPAFVEHRDFAPWNLKRLQDGRLTLLDWEWAVEKSLPWQDICRFFYIQDFLFRGPEKVWETLSSNPLLQTHLRRFDIPIAALPGLTMHYLLRVLCMDSISHDAEAAKYTMRQVDALLDATLGTDSKPVIRPHR